MMKNTNLELGVNIDHVATLRQVRGTDYPDLVEAARVCEAAGADGITIHLREDRRHIRDDDLYALRPAIKTFMNLEMACNEDVLRVALDVVPDEVCLVPERREELTTEGGLDVAGRHQLVAGYVGRLTQRGIAVSLFIEPDRQQVEAAAAAGARAIELHTGLWCGLDGAPAASEYERLRAAARQAADLGLQVNAGHGLTAKNVLPIAAIPQLTTLNIGHSIICRSLFVGLAGAVREMLKAMSQAREGRTGD